MSKKPKAPGGDARMELLRRPGLDQDHDLKIAELRLGCLKLASLFRTESMTAEQMKARADEFLAYVLGAKS